MNLPVDSQIIVSLGKAQKGVFSTSDLRTALAERHPAGFKRRVRDLINQKVLSRFTRGFYVAKEFELPTLSQRISPSSCVSFETVLADNLVIGANPSRRVVSVKVGRTRTYEAMGFGIEHLGISSELEFGCTEREGVRFADTEKALLDVLYFHLRGRRSTVDIYSDINLQAVNSARLLDYLKRYRNPKFVTFAKRVLRLA